MLVGEALRADCRHTLDILRLGKLASQWTSLQADRAAAVAEVRNWYVDAGLSGDVLHVNRQIKAWHLCALLDPKLVKTLGISVVYALLPLVRRDAKTAVWTIRPGLEDPAFQLLANLIEHRWTARRVTEEVAALFPPRTKRQPKASPKRLAKIQSQIKRLPAEQLIELRRWLDSLDRPAAAAA